MRFRVGPAEEALIDQSRLKISFLDLDVQRDEDPIFIHLKTADFQVSTHHKHDLT